MLLKHPERSRPVGKASEPLDGRSEAPRSTRSASREAAETGAGTLAVACPFCTIMLDDGVRQTETDLRVADVSTLLVEALERE